MNKPPGLNALFFTTSEQTALGSVETSPIVRLLRPATFVLWLLIFCVEAQTIIATGTGANLIVIAASTALFAGVHIQFWYEESEQGRRFHRAMERMRGRIYEDEFTGLPNSRHFVFELRRQMMRSVRNGHGFSLVLTDLGGFEKARGQEDTVLPAITRALRHAFGEGDFIAHLQGPIFAGIIMDERDRSAAAKADNLLPALGACVPLELAGAVFPVVSLSGYEGELEVRDFLRRAQRDLLGARSHGIDLPATAAHPKSQAAAA